MIYTSYFAAIKKFDKNCIPVAICGKAPESYNGVEYKKLAPKKDFFMKWKETGDNDYYCKNFAELVTGPQDPYAVVDEIINFLPGDIQQLIRSAAVPIWKNKDIHIVLVCYEQKGFCHRHLVADWMTNAGIPVKELLC